ncbi:MAG: helix-turn-helix domain-containing protein, partial [Roseibium sp.]
MWLNVLEFSERSGISPRKARQALQRAHAGKPWRKQILEVRLVDGTGGRSGLSYEVKACSLPRDLQVFCFEPTSLERKFANPTRRSVSSEFSRKVAWFRQTFAILLETEPGSSERGKLIAQIQGNTVIDWTGTPIVLKRRTLYSWIKQYEAKGPIGLKRAKRSDRGKSRCFISREWDRAVSGRFDDEIKAEIADGLRQQVRGLVKGGATGKIVAELACEYLKKVTVANGIH